MFLGGGKKPRNPKETHMHMGRICVEIPVTQIQVP